MPRLDWIGRKSIEHHHRQVPFHLLKEVPKLSVGDHGSGNLLMEGDNLLALKALLPYYSGQVQCIYIDPPYNTGNENWIYNDNVNSPEMREWLGKVVGKEAEDLSRHDKWLCMMYPRLAILWHFLREDGAIFISIDDNEVQNLRAMMDEIYGKNNFVTTVIWQKVYSPKNTAKHFSEDHDYIVVYAKKAEAWRPNLVSRSGDQDAAYKNRDADPRGPWKTSDLSARNPYSEGLYSVTCPSGRIIEGPPKGRYWTISKAKFDELNADDRIWWGNRGESIPQLKRFLSDVKQGVVPQTLWFYKDAGHTQDAKKELLQIVEFADSASVFITPKPTKLIKRILQVGAKKDSLILDSFAGSGTTGHAVLQLNKEDDGNRRCILVEMDSNICRNVTAERLRRVAQGYKNAKGEDVEGLGSGFRFATLGEPLFDERGNIRKSVEFDELARHVYFTETGEPLPDDSLHHSKSFEKDAGQAGMTTRAYSPLIGVCKGIAVYLLYNGILKDKSPTGGNVLTTAVLSHLPKHDGPKVIYGTACRIGPDRLRRENITFKQLPYKIKVM